MSLLLGMGAIKLDSTGEMLFLKGNALVGEVGDWGTYAKKISVQKGCPEA